MFTDSIKIKLIAGKGGNGVVAWRREKYLPKGGPYGGNGGRGGDVVVQGDGNFLSLDKFRNNRLIKAESGGDGRPNCQQGKCGKNYVIKVPCGTLVKDPETGVILCDITKPGQKEIICQGGRGGRGNASFKSSVRRAPNFATPGTEGEELSVHLELKLIADIGLVGFPNAGKSTLINTLTHSHAKCANYPFTTLRPNLGFIETKDYRRFFIADIPGIIEGAHQNKGLGLEFLKHIERTKILFFILDISQDDPMKEYQILRSEIEQYNPKILEKPSFVLLNKCDMGDFQEKINEFKSVNFNDRILEVSAKEGQGVEELKEVLFELKELETSYASL